MCIRNHAELRSAARVLAAFVLITVVGLLFPANLRATNEKCPVLPNVDASSDISTTYQGKEVRFCCNECKKEFDENPEVYVNQVPQLQELTLREEVGSYFDANSRFIASGALAAALVVLRLLRLRGRPTDPVAQSKFTQLFSRKISPTVPLIIVTGVLGYEVYSLRSQIETSQLEDQIHYATFYDYGYPPVPKRPDDENRLNDTYYRGNDERSPRLFNNGLYRTATFHIALVDASGKQVQVGDVVSGRELFVRLEVERPPFTPDFLYSDRLMHKMFLTEHCDALLHGDAIDDRVNLTAIEEMQRWEALYPVNVSKLEDGSHRGIIYVCEEYHQEPFWWSSTKEWVGSRFHYGIPYRVLVQDGAIAAESNVYMGTLYRTRKFPAWKVPITEWFSHDPIPELPSAPNTEDGELLGTDDYLDE